MQRKAVELDHQNILYAFSYNFSISNKMATSNLASKLLSDKAKLQWLASKGFPGQYVLGIIKAVGEGKEWAGDPVGEFEHDNESHS